MPQISQIAATYASQIFWLLITFGILYFGIGKMMVPKVMATVDARVRPANASDVRRRTAG